MQRTHTFSRTWLVTCLVILTTLPLSAQVIEEEEADEELDVFDEELEQSEDIMLPEGMNAEADSLLTAWNHLHYLTLPGDCEPVSEPVEYSKEDYIQRLTALPNVIEMPYNAVVRKFIDQYAGRLRRSVSIFLGAGNFYMPIFEEALEAYQLPLELKYLPVIESALNPTATSRAGAVGLWQFIITTGKLYGLEVTSLIDERRDPIKASYAAAHYLKALYDIFGDWTLAIASYNCGPGNVRKAISRAGGSKDYWQIYPYLPRETRGYVPAFIAANYIMTYYCEHNICPATAQLPAATDTVMVDRNLHVDQIIALCNISADALKALNPQYRTSLIPGFSHPCTLRLPNASMTAFIEAGDSIYAYRATELLTSRAEIEVAQAQLAPSNPKVSPRRGRGRGRSTGRGARSATVRRGDTLGAIAKRNGTTVAKLRKLNGIRGNTIKAGQKIRVK